MVQELVHNDPQMLSDAEYKDFLVYLVEKCLFTFHVEPLSNHITKDVDLVSYERPFINKCLAHDSRNACYKLLLTICEIKPEMISDIVKHQLLPLVLKIQKPQKAGFAPRFEGRSLHGYCGLKNLGAICYMIAMIQQLYHVPTFRYMLLAAKSQDPSNPHEFEG